jgi:hypothetical protein
MMLKALWACIRTGWSAWRRPREWELIGSYWHGPKGERLKAISGGEGFDDGGFGGLISGAVDAFGASAPDVASYAAPDPGAGGGGGGWWNAISGAAEKALPFIRGGIGLAQIPLGIKAMQDASSARDTLNKSVTTAQKTAAPAAAGAAALIPAAVSAELGGALPPEAEHDIQNKVNTYRQQQMQALVAQGMDPQTARAQIESAVGQYEQQLRSQWTQQLMGAGAGLTSAALGGTGQAAAIAGGQQQTTSAALNTANEALYRLLGGQA